jgi:hypothetical protein
LLCLALTAIAAALAFSIAGQGDAGVIDALFDLQWVMDVFAALPAAGFLWLHRSDRCVSVPFPFG